MSDNEKIESLARIAAYLGRSERTIRSWIEAGRPEAAAFRQMGGIYFAFKADLDRVLAGKAREIEA